MSIATEGIANPEFEFCDRIRKVRRDVAGMNQAEMADALTVGRQVYAAWESGRTRPTDIVDVAKRIAELWPGRVTPSWLLGLDNQPPTPPSHPFPQPRGGAVAPVRRLRSAGSGVGGQREDQRELVNAKADEINDDAEAYLRLADSLPGDSQPPTSKPVGKSSRAIRPALWSLPNTLKLTA